MRRMGLLLVVGVLAIGCSGGDGGSPAVGSALVAGGVQGRGTLGFASPTVGRVYRFAFPLITNRTKRSLQLTRFEVLQVDPNIKIVGYSVYNVREVGQIVETSIDGEGGELDMTAHRNYLDRKTQLIVGPGVNSAYVGMVALSLRKQTPASRELDATGCRVYYKSGNQQFRQDLACTFALGG